MSVRASERTLTRCRDCAHHQPSPPRVTPIAAWETPSGCAEGWVTPEAAPPIYPSTRWDCLGFAAKGEQIDSC
jgi:hypothetical protein